MATKSSVAVTTSDTKRASKGRSKGRVSKRKTAQGIGDSEVSQPDATGELTTTVPEVDNTQADHSAVAQPTHDAGERESDAQGDRTTAEPQTEQAAEYWTHKRGGFDALDAADQGHAQRDYSAWAEKNPEAASKYTLAQYVDFRQERHAQKEIEKQQRLANSSQRPDTETERAAHESGAPSEQHWTRQRNGYDSLTEVQKDAARADFDKWAQAHPEAADKYKLDGYVQFRQERCAEEFAMGAALRRAEQNIDRGPVTLTDRKHAIAVLNTVYGADRGKSLMQDLAAKVQPGERTSANIKGFCTVTLERSADGKHERVSLSPAHGKVKETKDALNKAARYAFARCSAEPKQQSREAKARTAELGR